VSKDERPTHDRDEEGVACASKPMFAGHALLTGSSRQNLPPREGDQVDFPQPYLFTLMAPIAPRAVTRVTTNQGIALFIHKIK
jgi:hypothetical protein